MYGTDYQFALILTQMSVAKRIKRFGQQAVNELVDEWCQLDTLLVFKGREFNTLKSIEHKAALHTAQLIKEKRTEE